MLPTPNPTVLSIDPYVPGKHGEDSAINRPLKLSANESSLGPAPGAVAALKKLSIDAHRYPDGDAKALRDALSERFEIPSDRIVCGAGSDELIALTCQAYLKPGDEILYPEHGFLMYAISALASGGVPKTAPEKNCRADIGALLDAVTPKTKIVFLANPNNPTGSYVTRQELADLQAGLPSHVLLVVDGAYREYVEQPDYSSGIELVSAGKQNVLVTGTLSKIFGLGGLRVGWAYGSDHLVDVLNRVRGPFNVSSAAQVAAVEALNDHEWEEKVRRLNNDQIGPLTQRITALGLRVYSTVANFILIDLGSDTKRIKVDQALQSKGIFLRQVSAYGLGTCLRMTIGTEAENDRVLEALSVLL